VVECVGVVGGAKARGIWFCSSSLKRRMGELGRARAQSPCFGGDGEEAEGVAGDQRQTKTTPQWSVGLYFF